MECEQLAKDLVSTVRLTFEFFCDGFLTACEPWQLARNVECEQLAKDAKEKLAQAKHEIACELVVKQTDIQRLKSEVQEMKMKYEHQDEDEIPMIGKVNLSRPHANKGGNKVYSECMQIKWEFKYRAYAAKRVSWSYDDTFKPQENKRAQRSALPPRGGPNGASGAEWKDMLLRCRELSALLKKRLCEDILAIERVQSSSNTSSKSTVSHAFCPLSQSCVFYVSDQVDLDV